MIGCRLICFLIWDRGSAQHRGPKGLFCAVFSMFYVLCSMFYDLPFMNHAGCSQWDNLSPDVLLFLP